MSELIFEYTITVKFKYTYLQQEYIQMIVGPDDWKLIWSMQSKQFDGYLLLILHPTYTMYHSVFIFPINCNYK